MKYLILMSILITSSSAHGFVYKWSDATGTVHYTNKEYEIPARYKSKAKALYPEQADVNTTGQNVTVQQPKPNAQQPSPPAQQANSAPTAETHSRINPTVPPSRRERRRRGPTGE